MRPDDSGTAEGDANVPATHERVADEVRDRYAGDSTGHDVAHAWRVYRLGRRLAAAEGADFDVVGPAALVHDLHRVREAEGGGEGEGEARPGGAASGFVHPRETLPEVRAILERAGVPGECHGAVCHCVAHHEEYDFALETDLDHEPTVEERVLRDADNLDALGAIGVARACFFGANHGQPLHDPARDPDATYDRTKRDNTVVQHLHEKVLRLPEAMETDAGRELARERGAFVERFAERVAAEWRGER